MSRIISKISGHVCMTINKDGHFIGREQRIRDMDNVVPWKPADIVRVQHWQASFSSQQQQYQQQRQKQKEKVRCFNSTKVKLAESIERLEGKVERLENEVEKKQKKLQEERARMGRRNVVWMKKIGVCRRNCTICKKGSLLFAMKLKKKIKKLMRY